MKRFKPFFFGLLAFIVPLAVLLGCLEIIFRHLDLRNAREFPNYVVNGTYTPVKIKSNHRGIVAGIPVSTNRNGLRDEPDFEPVPPPNEFRILSMGDSIAFGLGIKSHDSYAKVLERRLNENEGSSHYYVINSAGPGYSPSSYYLFLRNEGLQWQPRAVLIEIELTNDVTDEALLRWEVDPARPDRPKVLRGGRYVVAWDGMLLSAYIRGPYFYEKTYTYVELSRRTLDLLYRLSSTKPFPADPSVTYYTLGYEWYLLSQKRIESGWTRMFGALQATNELLRQRGVSFLLMIMPSRFVFERASEKQQNRFAQGLVNRAAEFARQHAIPYLDFTETIAAAGGEELFLDTVHLNEKGNLAVGSALFEHLKSRIVPTMPLR